MTKKIYFAASIRGGRDDVHIYRQLIEHLTKSGIVFTEHIGLDNVEDTEESFTDKQIHDRDIKWLQNADLIVAEVTTPSLGVGYEIGRAVELQKPVLCLFRKNSEKLLSAMISGSEGVETIFYTNIDDAKQLINNYLDKS